MKCLICGESVDYLGRECPHCHGDKEPSRAIFHKSLAAGVAAMLVCTLTGAGYAGIGGMVVGSLAGIFAGGIASAAVTVAAFRRK